MTKVHSQPMSVGWLGALQRAETRIRELEESLKEARDELVEHNMDYHHQTDRSILARINAALQPKDGS